VLMVLLVLALVVLIAFEIGWGRRSGEELFALKASEESGGKRAPRVIDPGHGPVITSAVRVGGEPGFYLEDAGFPEYVAWMLQMFGIPEPLRDSRDIGRASVRPTFRNKRSEIC
jgi:hypothetical protein